MWSIKKAQLLEFVSRKFRCHLIYHGPWADFLNVSKFLHFVAIVSNKTFFSTLDEKWEDRAPDMFLYNSLQFASQKNNISSLVKKYYFGDQKISNNTIEELFQVKLTFTCYILNQKNYERPITQL